MTGTQRLSLAEFSRSLVQTGDLDPIYVMLRAANLPPTTLRQWAIAYWLFYHAGMASLLATAPPDKFWELVRINAHPDTKAPRGTERRHFRAKNAELAITALAARYPEPEQMITQLPGFGLAGHIVPLPGMMRAVQRWPQFGPWIAFKVSDMADAVLGIPVNFEGYEQLLFDAPQKGAWMYMTPDHTVTGYDEAPASLRLLAVQQAVAYLRVATGNLRCPHADRALRTQEFETMLCKWKSHLNGHYPVGKDTHEIRQALTDYGKLADHLRQYLP